MKLIAIPEFKEYLIDAMFDCYKWDPEYSDFQTLAKYALVLSEEEAKLIAKLTEDLDKETRAAEEFLNTHQELTKVLKIPRKIRKYLASMDNYDNTKHIRLMRYDFHPTTDGWQVSEVNSDVPGGFAEASLLPKLAIKYLKSNKYESIDFGEILSKRIQDKIKESGTIMFVHCTSFSDDRQVMQFIGDKMSYLGYKSLYGAADHVVFKNKKAISILDNNEGDIDCIFRFTPLEWLKDMKFNTWKGYFDTVTPSCNHPIAIYAQTKRFPLVFDILEKNNISMSTWKKLLPETKEANFAQMDNSYIFKPAWGRVGEKIAIEGACSKEEYESIIKDVKRHPQNYVLQKKFISVPLDSEDGDFHICLGSYTVDGRHAGFYARISKKARIDSDAKDCPVIIEGGSIC